MVEKRDAMIGVKVPVSVKNKLLEIAESERRTLSQIVLMILEGAVGDAGALITLPRSLHDALAELARQEGRSLQWVACDILEREITRIDPALLGRGPQQVGEPVLNDDAAPPARVGYSIPRLKYPGVEDQARGTPGEATPDQAGTFAGDRELSEAWAAVPPHVQAHLRDFLVKEAALEAGRAAGAPEDEPEDEPDGAAAVGRSARGR